MEAAKWNCFPKNTTCYDSGLTGPTRFYHVGRAVTTTKAIHAKLDKTHLSWLLHSSMPESGPLNCWDNICDENRATDIIKVNCDKYMPCPPFPVQNNHWYIQEYTALPLSLNYFYFLKVILHLLVLGSQSQSQDSLIQLSRHVKCLPKSILPPKFSILFFSSTPPPFLPH